MPASSTSTPTEHLPLSIVAEMMDFVTVDGQPLQDYLSVFRRLEPFSQAWDKLEELQRRFCHPVLPTMAREQRKVEQHLRLVLEEPDRIAREAGSYECTELRSWTLVMRLCEACVEVAAHDPRRGLAVARAARALAVRAGNLYHEEERRQLEALTWAHEANAHRVPGHLRQAQRCFEKVEALEAGEESYRIPGIWAEIRWIEGSLMRDCRRMSAARTCLLEATKLASESGRTAVQAGSLLNLASLDYEAGEHEAAVAKTRETLQLVTLEQQPRWYVQALLNLASYLNRCGQAEEALTQLERNRDVIHQYGNPSDCLRAQWSKATALRTLRRFDEAIPLYDCARRGFLELEHIDSMAIVTLELAIVHLEQGHTAEVKRLAAEILPVFEMQGIDREARATLELFRQAVAAEQVTLLQLRGWLGRLGA